MRDKNFRTRTAGSQEISRTFRNVDRSVPAARAPESDDERTDGSVGGLKDVNRY